MELSHSYTVWERVGSLACLASVFGVLVTYDPSLQQRLGIAIEMAVRRSVSFWNTYLQMAGDPLIEAVRRQSFAEAPLLIFAISAALLVLSMRRA